MKTINTDPEPTQRDKMPPSMISQMTDILAKFGIDVGSHEEAWGILSGRSKTTSVEDRIVARIAYLIMNATVHKDQKMIGQSRKLLP